MMAVQEKRKLPQLTEIMERNTTDDDAMKKREAWSGNMVWPHPSDYLTKAEDAHFIPLISLEGKRCATGGDSEGSQEGIVSGFQKLEVYCGGKIQLNI